MALLSSLAFIAVTKLGLKVAEKKKWLPAGVYHQLTMEKLRQGDLRQAIRLNEIALQKDPDLEKALVVKDLIAMRRDALLHHVLKDLEQEKNAIREIQSKSLSISRELGRLRTVERMNKFAPWVFLFLNIFTYLSSYLLIVLWNRFISGSLLGGFAVICTMFIYMLFRRMFDQNIQINLRRQELFAAQKSMAHELEIRTRQLRRLQSKLSETRHQLREQ